jgi:LysM repeat protein
VYSANVRRRFVAVGFVAQFRLFHVVRLVRGVVSALGVLLVAGCSIPEPPPSNLPTAPAVLDITPAPTLDIDATATSYASLLRPSPTPAGLYIVKEGDTLGSLATQFGTTVEAILAANNLTDPNALQVGQALIIPSLLATPRPATPVVEGTADPAATPSISVTQAP